MVALVALVVLIAVFWLGRCTGPAKFVMPTIVTVHDTTPGLSRTDTLRLTRIQKIVEEKTANVLVRETVVKVDTVRDSIFLRDTLPINYYVSDLLAGQRLGESTFVHTVRSDGQRGINTYFTLGPILAIEAGPDPAPRIRFGTFPKKHHGLVTDILISGVSASAGFAACEIVNRVGGQ